MPLFNDSWATFFHQDFSPARSINGGGGRFFDFHDGDLLLAVDMSDDESLYESSRNLEDEGR